MGLKVGVDPEAILRKLVNEPGDEHRGMQHYADLDAGILDLHLDHLTDDEMAYLRSLQKVDADWVDVTDRVVGPATVTPGRSGSEPVTYSLEGVVDELGLTQAEIDAADDL